MSSNLLRGRAEQVFVPGAAGRIEVVIDAQDTPEPRGIAVVAHPHPLYGGALDNKVAQTLARAMAGLGYVALRPNFRGVGETEGAHDHGEGETDDILTVVDYARGRFGDLSVVLAGYSFGAHVQTQAAARLVGKGTPPERLVLVATAAGFVSGGRAYKPVSVAANTLVIHGEEDTTVPLSNVFDWLRPQDIPVTVIPGTDHFFHRKLGIIKSIIVGQWH
ncbi:MAG TPA: CocE/NonD family hydrolase [Burkholderiales bacterium]|nr:CocE/NonD family hydrolase [Burkholderiales bacterium]